MNDENFLINSNNLIEQLREDINNLELDTKLREEQTEQINSKLEEYKKQTFTSKGYIDDTTVSTDDQIKDLESQIALLKLNEEHEEDIYKEKQRLLHVMRHKVEKTNEFFIGTEGLFIKYFDCLKKVTEG